jgi:hypothetical protein
MANELEELNQKIDKGLKDIQDLIPDDAVSSATGAKVGTEEHTQQNELLDKVKETNSTKRVNRILTILKWVGYIGLFISSIIKFTGIIYDIDFHVPSLKHVIGEIGIGTLGFFITVIIIITTHITSDGLVNNKWKTVPRLVLIWLAMVGLSASFYFDYRAINNYTDVVVAEIKKEKIKDSHDTDGVIVSAVDSSVKLIESNLKMYQSSLQKTEDRLQEITESRNKINESIETSKGLKDKTNSNKEIRKINQNIYTSRKQLTELASEEERINQRQSNLMVKMSDITEKLDAKVIQKKNLLENVDKKMSKEQFNRLVFLFVLVIFIEITSFGSLLADFLGNANLETELKDNLDELSNRANAMSVLKGHITAMEVKQARDFDKELTTRGAISDIHSLSSIANMYRQAENVKSLTQATYKIGEATQEVTELAVEGVASSIRANLAIDRIKKLEEIITEQKK